ncbi:hypothetical protein [Streptomyces sp. NBC_01803]|uniref:hypothetical protein n=1 Tax=Streptomyces sp. NBC_01803 TaxID=2975946 RepID=UPI002DDA352B|nr:hypothetical protein [Streptomyces sp. NBC_01803]WSA43350.1 hypothetical protein OIE51_03560 [Streptomyces sp. NBC_01803]
MRNDIETREIADSELDAVAGGVVSVSGGLAGAVVSDVAGAASSLHTVGAVQGLAAQGLAQVSAVTGVQVDTGALTGPLGL